MTVIPSEQLEDEFAMSGEMILNRQIENVQFSVNVELPCHFEKLIKIGYSSHAVLRLTDELDNSPVVKLRPPII